MNILTMGPTDRATFSITPLLTYKGWGHYLSYETGDEEKGDFTMHWIADPVGKLYHIEKPTFGFMTFEEFQKEIDRHEQ